MPPPFLPLHIILRDMKSDERREVLRDLYSRLNHDQQRQLVNYLYNMNNQHIRTLIDQDDIVDTVYHQEILDQRGITFKVTMKKLEGGKIEVRCGDSFILYQPCFSDSGGVSFTVVEDHIESEEEKGIVPLIVWQEDLNSGMKAYWCEPVPKTISDSIPELFTPRHDTLLGQMVIAGNSENVRETLPKELCLEPGGRPQKMRGAQSPVVCRLYNDRFLRASPVIAAFESKLQGG